MNTKSLEQMKEEIKREKELRIKLSKVQQRLEELKETKEVQEYLKLKELDTEENRRLMAQQEDIIENRIILKYLEDTAQEGEIYYCLGKNLNAYKLEKGYYILNLESYNVTKVALYKSLISTNQIIIEIGKEKEFEKENRVIVTSVPSMEEYHKIQREYFEKIFETNETESKQYILSKYRLKE